MRRCLKLSASSVKKFAGCPRRWAFAAIGGWREPQSPYTWQGTVCHEITERWLTAGVLRGEGEWGPASAKIQAVDVVAQGLGELPAPGTCGVEVPFEFEFDGHLFRGFIDVLDWRSQQKIDHKFSGNLDYALTPETMVEDFQVMLYALAPPRWESTTVHWNYVRKKGKGCQPSKAVVTRPQVEAFVRREILPLAVEMEEYYDAFAGLSGDGALTLINELVPCEPGDCWSFGIHCPHGARCSHEGFR